MTSSVSKGVNKAGPLPLAVFTADDEQIFTVTLDFPVHACKNASLSLPNVAWYVLHTVQSRSSACSHGASQSVEYM